MNFDSSYLSFVCSPVSEVDRAGAVGTVELQLELLSCFIIA